MPKARVKADIHQALGGAGGGGIVVIGGATVSTTQLQDLALNSILLLKQGAAAPLVFDLGTVGFAAALAAAGSRDVIWTGAGTIGGDHTIPAGVTVSSMPFSRTAFSGCLTLGNGAVLNGLELYRVADQAGDLICLVPPAGDGEMAYCGYCWIVANNATGAGYAAKGACNHLTLRSCYVSAQSAGVDSNPFGGIPASWPTEVYAATGSGGIYYSGDFTGPAGDMPTWTAINGGLSGLGVRSFCVDLYSGGDYQYCVTTSDNTVWMRTDGNWTAVLTTAAARALVGVAEGNCWYVACNPTTGRVWVNFALEKTADNRKLYALYSDDHGSSWTAVAIGNSLKYNYSIGTIDAYGSTVVSARVVNFAASAKLHAYSSDSGATWNEVAENDFTGGNDTVGVRINPADNSYWFTHAYIDPSPLTVQVKRFKTDGTQTTFTNVAVFGPYTHGGWWMSDNDFNAMGTTSRTSTTYFYETEDGYATLKDDTPSPWDVSEIREIAEQCPHGYWVVGRGATGNGCVRVSTDGVNTTNRSGANNGTPPYTDSIPDTCNGIIGRGLWAVPAATMSGTPYCYGCIIGNADGRAAVVPEYGDRASWRTDYDDGATHADDWVAGDSHHPAVTLGAGSAEELTIDGQELTLAEVLTPTEHTAIGDAAPHHAAVTLGADAGAVLGLTGQQLDLDAQSANVVLAGPASGAAAAPTFRALSNADLPDPLAFKTAASALTIVAGAVTATQNLHTITSETGTTDDLTTITAAADRTLLLIQATATHTITVKHGTGNISLNGAADFVLSGDKALLLYWNGTAWVDVGSGGAAGALADHDHSGDAGDGGTFDAANLTSGAAADGQVLTADGSGGAAWEDAPGSPLTVEEQDGTPSVASVEKIRVTNGTLTDEGSGIVKLDFGSAATDGSAIHDNVAEEIHAVTEKATPADNDELLIEDSADSWAKKRVTVGAVQGAAQEACINIVIDGGGSAITAGIKCDLEIPFACTINRATLLADQDGDIVIDIWVDTYANFPPTVADTITAAAKPTLAGADSYQDATLTGWTTALAAGAILRINVDSAATVTRVTLSLKVTRS